MRHPQRLSLLPLHSIIGLALVLIGFIVLRRTAYPGTQSLVDSHDPGKDINSLSTVYHYTRNPMYLGVFLMATGLPVHVATLYGFFNGVGPDSDFS